MLHFTRTDLGSASSGKSCLFQPTKSTALPCILYSGPHLWNSLPPVLSDRSLSLYIDSFAYYWRPVCLFSHLQWWSEVIKWCDIICLVFFRIIIIIWDFSIVFSIGAFFDIRWQQVSHCLCSRRIFSSLVMPLRLVSTLRSQRTTLCPVLDHWLMSAHLRLRLSFALKQVSGKVNVIQNMVSTQKWCLCFWSSVSIYSHYSWELHARLIS